MDRVTVFAVYGQWDCLVPVAESALEIMSRRFRPDDEGVCIWTPGARPSTFILSLDVEAEDFESAIASGLEALTEAANLVDLAGAPEWVEAMTEERTAQWRPDSH